MREVNFSIPTGNKASVSITTALYDRRALDCTSTLPLINSLNHLAYLTTSSSRIRDILTVDGGVERLVCILKEGRGKDVMDIWKWSLAFQCIVNIGVRGSEAVRTRVVEADVVPVISTILDNYIRVVEMCRERAEADVSGPAGGSTSKSRDRSAGTRACLVHPTGQTSAPASTLAFSAASTAATAATATATAAATSTSNSEQTSGAETSGSGSSSSSSSRSQHHHHSHPHSSHRSRRNPPPNINIPRNNTMTEPRAAWTDPTAGASASPPSQAGQSNSHSRHTSRHSAFPPSSASSSTTHTPSRLTRSHQMLSTETTIHSAAGSDAGSALVTPEPLGLALSHGSLQPPISPSSHTTIRETTALVQSGASPDDRTPREGDRFSLISRLPAALGSQPISPTTPGTNMNAITSAISDVDAIPATDMVAALEPRRPSLARRDPNSAIDLDDADIHMQDIHGDESLDTTEPLRLVPDQANSDGPDGFAMAGQAELGDRTIARPAEPATRMPFGPTRVSNSPSEMHGQGGGFSFAWQPRSLVDRNLAASLLAAMPRDDDVLMSLQLLAYVSKYCNLRNYFQETHLVPRLKIGQHLLDAEFINPGSGPDGRAPVQVPDQAELEEEWDSEYVLPQDVNIFPLVEKFTIRHNSQEMQYWAGVVMRNLCRKDDSRGGIRQCAYYKCGKWEEYPRQFAKCRRCRRTKYCSKDCQKNAWAYHRHWCVQALPPQSCDRASG